MYRTAYKPTVREQFIPERVGKLEQIWLCLLGPITFLIYTFVGCFIKWNHKDSVHFYLWQAVSKFTSKTLLRICLTYLLFYVALVFNGATIYTIHLLIGLLSFYYIVIVTTLLFIVIRSWFEKDRND